MSLSNQPPNTHHPPHAPRPPAWHWNRLLPRPHRNRWHPIHTPERQRLMADLRLQRRSRGSR
jgi:hypothetical protein